MHGPIYGQHDGMERSLVRADPITQSNPVLPLAQGDGFILIPAERTKLATGKLDEFLPFETRE
ncbi:MAG: hypothetical protein P8X69_14755 [Maritimibacter sp.]